MGGLCYEYDSKEETFINKNKSFLLIAAVINIAIWIFVQEQMTNAEADHAILSINQPKICE
jgi:hypothetical protein